MSNKDDDDDGGGGDIKFGECQHSVIWRLFRLIYVSVKNLRNNLADMVQFIHQ